MGGSNGWKRILLGNDQRDVRSWHTRDCKFRDRAVDLTAHSKP